MTHADNAVRRQRHGVPAEVAPPLMVLATDYDAVALERHELRVRERMLRQLLRGILRRMTPYEDRYSLALSDDELACIRALACGAP